MTQASDEPLLNAEAAPGSILIPVDSSAGASRVISAGARIARLNPVATVHVAHVFRTSRFDRARAGAPLPPSGDLIDEAKEQLEAHVRAARRQCRNTVTSHFVVGDPTSEVLRLAGELKIELLVIGTHDYAGFERFLLGSIAETLVRKAHCSVYVVRPTAYRE
ncbi:MAG TPA: universal stress protein [Polyangiaceae bacterium]|jgi:nucleotide-binding universal stress UspA family protein|nr:universal stress protein [Polyangiaceae bacterium]